MTAPDPVGHLVDLEHRRLRALVEVRVAEAESLHAPDFVLVNPSGVAWSRAKYLGGIASGAIDYRRFEPVSDIEVMFEGDLAVLRYRSAIEVSVVGRDSGPLECWHLDCYRRVHNGQWQVRWSQATAVED